MCQCVQKCSGKCVKPECKPKDNPRKHAAVIVAWAYGAEVQYQSEANGVWIDVYEPVFNPNKNYRIKQEVKPDCVYYTRIKVGSDCELGKRKLVYDNVKFTFDGETGKLKSVEML